jgi:hypothetical protein
LAIFPSDREVTPPFSRKGGKNNEENLFCDFYMFNMGIARFTFTCTSGRENTCKGIKKRDKVRGEG